MFFKKKISSLGFTKNNLTINDNSIFKLEIENGSVFEWKLPTIIINGLLEEESIIKLNGKFEIYDKINNIISRVGFTKDHNFMTSIKNVFFEKEKEFTQADKNEFLISIFKRVGKGKMIFGKGFGNYARYIVIDDKIYWNNVINNKKYVTEFENENDINILPGSSTKRKEIKKIEEKSYIEADLIFDENEKEKIRIFNLKEKNSFEFKSPF